MKYKPGQSGNPFGRKPGSRNRATQLRDQLEAELPDILKTVVAAAKGGDMTAARMLLDRILPPLRAVDLPQAIEASGSTPDALAAAIVREAVAGNITPDVAKELTAALSAVVKIKEATDFEQRLAALESRLPKTREPLP